MSADTEIRRDVSAAPPDASRRSGDRLVWLVIAVAVALFWLIATSWRPWDLLDRAGFSADFYDEQARSLLRGRLAVRPEVPGPEGFLIDGRTYLYYGPFLAVARLPFALFGNAFTGRLVVMSMLVAVVVLGRWSARLARAGRDLTTSVLRADEPAERDGSHAERERWVVPVFVGAVLFSPALFAAGWVSVYHETELWASTLAVIAVTLLAEWANGGRTDRRRLLGGSAAVLATTMTRAPIGLGLAFALGVAGLLLAWRSRRRGGRDGWIAVVGGLASLATYVAVNLAKFATPFSVPGDRQVLSLNDPTRAAFFEATGGSFFDPRFLPTTIVQYLRPDTIRFERLVPGIRFGPLAANRGSLDVETVTPASSLPVSATILVVLAIVGVAWLVRHVRRGGGFWIVLAGGGVLGAIPSFLIGFVANRYLIDMLSPLITAAAVGIWILVARSRRRARRAIAVGGLVLCVWGAWVNGALATWTMELKSPGFTELRSDVDAALFGGGDVGIVTFPERGGTNLGSTRDGTVALVGSCAGVYIREQGNWVALERLPGVFEATATLTDGAFADGPVRIAQTPAWTVDAFSSGSGGSVVAYATASDPNVVSIVVRDELPVDVRVVADAFNRQAILQVGGDSRLLPGDALDLVSTTAGIGPTADPDPERLAPLCTELASRRD